jgi:spoIIIJ-associated protein
MEQKEQKIVTKAFGELHKLLGIDGTFEVNAETPDVITIVLQTQDTGIVIGYHGEVLESLQLISSLCISKQLGRFVRVSLEVGDYKKNRTDYLERLAMQTKDRVLQEGREISLPSLKSWERRIVHMYLQDDEEVASESMGEGRERTLVVKPRQ